MGMGIAVCILQRSLDKERYRDTLQFETVCMLRSTYSNIWYASRHTLTISVMARGIKKTYVTSCSTDGLWFESFVIGMHTQMGNKVYQDQAVTLVLVHKLVDRLEREYLASKIEKEKEGFVDQAIFILAAFLVVLREMRILSWYWGRQELILWRLEAIRI